MATWTVTIDSAAAGTFNVTASDTVTMGGVAVTRSTGDGFSSDDGGDGASAVKNYVDALISITPLTPVNEVNHAETFTVTATAFPAGTGAPSFGTLGVTVSGGLTPTVSGPSVSGDVATWTVTIDSDAAGTFNVQASDTVTMGGVAVTRTTGDGFSSGDGGDGASAVKNYVDALIGITPLTPVNVVGDPETFTVTATAFPAGTGAPSFGALGVTVSGGLTPTVSGPTVSGDVATWTVTIDSAAAGTFNVTASDTVTMGGVAVTRTTGDGFSSDDGGDSASAVKTYEDEYVMIAPNGSNVVGNPHTFTATVYLNDGDGTGFHAVGAGVAVTLTLTSSNGASITPITPAAASSVSGNVDTFNLTTNANGQASVTFTSPTAGQVVGSASATLSIPGGGSVTRTTGDTDPLDGPSATKYFLSLTTNPGGSVVIGGGTPLSDSATLAGGDNPGGTITFYLMAPGSTSGTPLSSAVYTDAVNVSGDNTYSTSSGTSTGSTCRRRRARTSGWRSTAATPTTPRTPAPLATSRKPSARPPPRSTPPQA